MNKFCVITNRDKDENLEITTMIMNYFHTHQKECVLLDYNIPEEDYYYFTNPLRIPDGTDCAIVLGGDGTMIQAAHDLNGLNIPILGVNLGTLGYLAEIEPQGVEEALHKLFQNEYRVETRMMLYGIIQNKDTKIYEGSSLNDIVITRSGFSRIISLSIWVNDTLALRYRGDGVIISTPTGSTGYNLSAGGPVIKPDTKVMIITPICPHSLHSRSIVVSPEDRIRIQIDKSKKTQEDEAIATFDGRKGILLHTEDMIEVCKAKEETRLIKMNQINFYEILRTKIGQGGE